jgi:hypothetical protein
VSLSAIQALEHHGMFSTDNELELAASVGSEDLRCGDYVAVLSVTYEYPSFLWCSDSTLMPRHEPVRLQYLDASDGRLLKIKAVCLPFVFVKEPSGGYRTLDVRLCRLARLAPKYARRVWRTLRRKRRKIGAE